MPTGRDLLAAATGPDGRIYAIGGGGGLSTVEAYDTQAATTKPVVATPPLPLVYSNGCPGNQAATFEPTEIPLACADGNSYVSSLTWSSWTATNAQGLGTLNTNNCQPTCAQGTFTTSSASVVLSDPLNSRTQGLVFATITVTPQGGPSQSEDIGPDRCVNDPSATYC